MKKTGIALSIICATALQGIVLAQPSGKEILDRIDRNMSSETRYFKSTMIIHGARYSRTIESQSWAEGDQKAYTEYLSPAREAGTKMLKLEDQLLSLIHI